MVLARTWKQGVQSPNEGFIDFWVSKVWYKVHTTLRGGGGGGGGGGF